MDQTPPCTSTDRLPLLPPGFGRAGWALLTPALLLGLWRIYLGKPAILELRVPAIYSQYFGTRWFTVIQNNLAEEIAGILLLLALVFIGFSRSSDDGPKTDAVRIRCLFIAIYINAGLLLLSFAFVFGLGFVHILTANVFSMLAIYAAMVRLLVLKNRRR